MTTDGRAREAISTLADHIAEIAARCWTDLGTDASNRIAREASRIADEFRPAAAVEGNRDGWN